MISSTSRYRPGRVSEHRADRRLDARVGHDDVDAPEGTKHDIDRAARGGKVRSISTRGRRIAPRPGDVFHPVGKRARPTAHHRDDCASRGKCLRGRRPDPRATACHYGNFPAESAGFPRCHPPGAWDQWFAMT